MKRLIRKATEEKMSLFESVKKLDTLVLDNMTDEIINYAKSWADMSEDYDEDLNDLDSFDLSNDFAEDMVKDPDKILETVIDCFPDSFDSDEIYNSPLNDRVESVKFILDYSDAATAKTFDDLINKIQDNESQDPNENNAPYGPGMNQRDFV